VKRRHNHRNHDGLNRGQVAGEMGLTYRKLFDLESSLVIPPTSMDSFLQAIIKLQNLGRSTETAVSYSNPTKARRAVAAK
jgi:hypothetical protein